MSNEDNVSNGDEMVSEGSPVNPNLDLRDWANGSNVHPVLPGIEEVSQEPDFVPEDEVPSK